MVDDSEGPFVEIGGVECFRIQDVDRMEPFLTTVVSDADPVRLLRVGSTRVTRCFRTSPMTCFIGVPGRLVRLPPLRERSMVAAGCGGRSILSPHRVADDPSRRASLETVSSSKKPTLNGASE